MLPWNGLIAENSPRKTVPSTSSGKSIGNQRRGRKISEGREERERERALLIGRRYSEKAANTFTLVSR